MSIVNAVLNNRQYKNSNICIRVEQTQANVMCTWLISVVMRAPLRTPAPRSRALLAISFRFTYSSPAKNNSISNCAFRWEHLCSLYQPPYLTIHHFCLEGQLCNFFCVRQQMYTPTKKVGRSARGGSCNFFQGLIVIFL